MKFWRPFCLCKLDGQELKIPLGNRVFRIQHTQIRLKSLVPNFYPKMLLTFTFFRNLTSLFLILNRDSPFKRIVVLFPKLWLAILMTSFEMNSDPSSWWWIVIFWYNYSELNSNPMNSDNCEWWAWPKLGIGFLGMLEYILSWSCRKLIAASKKRGKKHLLSFSQYCTKNFKSIPSHAGACSSSRTLWTEKQPCHRTFGLVALFAYIFTQCGYLVPIMMIRKSYPLQQHAPTF